MIGGNLGSVYGYNYAINDVYNNPSTNFIAGATIHEAGVEYILLEGNVLPGFNADRSGGFNTLFRNYLRLLGRTAASLDALKSTGVALELMNEPPPRAPLWRPMLDAAYRTVRKEAVRQAREAVDLLGHHPSVAVWCGHNDPLAVDTGPEHAKGESASEIASFVRVLLERARR